jgi:hypothetical protein
MKSYLFTKSVVLGSSALAAVALCTLTSMLAARAFMDSPATAVSQAGSEKQEPAAFSFPGDGSGKLLADKLPPGGQGQVPKMPASKPQPRTVPEAVANPLTTAPSPQVPPPKLQTEAPGAAPWPAPIPEDLPLVDYAATPTVPEIRTLPVAPAIKVPSPDVNQPPALGQVTQPAPDTPNLADPTQEASQQAALMGSASPRTEAAPFLRLFLPDPFANRNAAALPELLPEDATPLTIAPQVPSK